MIEIPARFQDPEIWLGECYMAACKLAMAVPELIVCHGIVTGQGGEVRGKRLHHAWCETADGSTVYDPTCGPLPCLRVLYYLIAEIVPAEVKKYTAQEACLRSVQDGHWGPWDGTRVKKGRVIRPRQRRRA